MDTISLLASARFGLGPAVNEMKTMGSDPKGWLKQQIREAAIPVLLQNLIDNTSTELLYREFEENRRAQQLQRQQSQSTQQTAAQPSTPQPAPAQPIQQQASAQQTLNPTNTLINRPQKALREAYAKQTADRFMAQIHSQQPFIERLLLFWSNHFTVSIKKPRLLGLVNPYEVQAIRPHLTGRFSDMLLAVTQHPAMLIYLDNVRSIGPNSRIGVKRNKSINENLGREILELHTLGVDGGYTQDDVIALAKMISGWSLAREEGEPVMRFAFQEAMHEPGSKTLLGKLYNEDGIEQGKRALNDLANHPATAKHIATKLARHFISDEPPAAAVETLTRVFLKTQGDLTSVYHTLIGLSEAWRNPLEKFKNSYEYVLSALRLNEIKPGTAKIAKTFRAINITPFSAPSPAGLPDTASYWSGSDVILKRIEWARIISQNIRDQTNALVIAQDLYGPLLHDTTSSIIAGAPSSQDAFAFLLASPEFQRR